MSSERDGLISESGCCDGWSSKISEVNGICPKCEEATVDGAAPSGCSYSPILCNECGSAPCDGSC